ncbi:hypothetical protein BDQ17DRAFT_1373091 [Cyathus striatus]|nr:hypothetical protein BDQ17DRAFT_1373091 [Cyathus striatus]
MSTLFGQAIATDHRTVYALRDQYLASSSNPEQQKLLAQQLIWEIARHVTTEEILVHPLCTKLLGEEMGGKLAQFDGSEHSAVKDNLLVLLNQNLSPGDTTFDNGLEKILADLHRHNDSEESSDVPTLEQRMTIDQAQELAEAFEGAKLFFLPERFDKGAGETITEKALKGALTTPSKQLAEELYAFLKISPRCR